MSRKILISAMGACIAMISSAGAQSDDGLLGSRHDIKHVLLLSVDGLHALDLANFVNAHPDSNLAELHGTE